MKPVEEKIAKVSNHRKCRMIRNPGRGVVLSSENPDDSLHVGHVMHGDQLSFGRPFVKRFTLLYLTVVCLSGL